MGPVNDVVNVIAFLHVEIVCRTGRAYVGKRIVAGSAVKAYLEQGKAALSETWNSKLRSKVSPAVDRELRSEIFAEYASRIAQTEIIDNA